MIGSRIPEDNASGCDAYHLGTGVGANGFPAFKEGLGLSSYFEATRLPGGKDIVYQQGYQTITGNIAKFLGVTHAMATDVNRVQIGIIAEADCRDLWLTALVDGCQSAQPLGL